MITAQEIINRFDDDHPNTIPTERKLRWLRRFELQVMADVMHQLDQKNLSGLTVTNRGITMYTERDDLLAHYDPETQSLDISDFPDLYIDGDNLIMTSYEPTEGFREADDFSAETYLQIEEPYDDVYEYYLDQMIAQTTGDIKRYNRASELFNTAYLRFQKYYHRNHRSNWSRPRLLRHEVL